MAIRFGEYLVERGVVTEAQLSAAIQEQVLRQKPLGRVAVESGHLDMRQVMKVLRFQDGAAECLRFGTIAVELGLLSESQLAALLRRQRESRPPLGAILVEMGLLASGELKLELAGFHQHRELPAFDGRPGSEVAG